MVPDVVDASINDNPNDSHWATLTSDFSELVIFGTKNLDGTINRVQRMVVTSFRDGSTHTIDFDENERVASWGDDQGNLALFAYTSAQLLVDFVDSSGEVSSFSVPLSELPELPPKLKRDDQSKKGSPTAQTLVTPETAAIVTTVRRNGSLVNNALVTASVDYLSFQLPSLFSSDGPFANKYFASFVHRRTPFTTRFDACVEQTNSINTKIKVMALSVLTVAAVCKVVAGPGILLCFMMDGGAFILLEVGLAVGEGITEFPDFACGGQLIPADPDSANILVTATLPGMETQTIQRTVNLRDLPDPRVLNFAFDFDSPSGGCAPNATFNVIDFNNGEDGGTLPLICVRGDSMTPVFEWPSQVSNIYAILVTTRGTTVSETVWEIGVENTLFPSDDRIISPVTYGTVPTNVAI